MPSTAIVRFITFDISKFEISGKFVGKCCVELLRTLLYSNKRTKWRKRGFECNKEAPFASYARLVLV